MRASRLIPLVLIPVLVLGSLVVLPRAASAGPPELAGEHFSEAFAFDCEGLWVEGVVSGVHTHPIREDKDGNVIFTDAGRWEATYTNPLNGTSETEVYAGRQTHTGYQNEDGTWTFIDTYTGIPTSLGGTGKGAVKDRGRVVFTAVVNLNDPDDPFDDELVSIEIEVAGPHPQLEPGFNFCDALKAAIG
jgi:hypothetical protein